MIILEVWLARMIFLNHLTFSKREIFYDLFTVSNLGYLKTFRHVAGLQPANYLAVIEQLEVRERWKDIGGAVGVLFWYNHGISNFHVHFFSWHCTSKLHPFHTWSHFLHQRWFILNPAFWVITFREVALHERVENMIATSVIWSLASSLTQETGLFEDTNTSRNCSDTQRPSKRMFGAHDCWRIDPQATIFTHPNWPSPRKWVGYQLHVKQGKCPLWVPGSGEKILKARGWKWVEVRGWNVWYTVLQASQIVHQPARFIMIHPWKTHMFCNYILLWSTVEIYPSKRMGTPLKRKPNDGGP